ncbi:MAG TPA: hypothetical protein VE077_09850 [Candidatus Methylomirabilis sp.]|nr:hypothetical protein [Candidatus Methylomirabilis sp.]
MHPFIAEGGCGVYLPQDYFHLRPERAPRSGSSGDATVRLGRFTCLPVARRQPAAAEALEALANDSEVAIVRLSSLSRRELAQNSGLPPREAELARHRDFDEPFFFAGASPAEIERFKNMALEKECQVRERGSLWSLAIDASVPLCIRELSKLYDRALHSHARSVALAVEDHHEELVMTCDRTIILTLAADPQVKTGEQSQRKVIAVPMRAADRWEQILATVSERP